MPLIDPVVPNIDFSPLGNLGNVYQTARKDNLRERTLANLGQGGAADAQSLLKSGDLSLAQLGINIKNHQDELARQAQQDARLASNDKFSQSVQLQQLALSKRAAERADEDKFGVKEITDPATGATSFVKYNMRTGDVVPTGPQPTATAPTNPFNETGGKFNNEQGKAAGFTDRMLQSEGILGQPNVQSQGSSIVQGGLSKIPVAGNYLVSVDRQKYEQAKRDFINAQLRRESGAAISASEFENADKQYFPVPGDSEEVKRQKAANRRAAVEAMGREGGPAYRPKSIYTQDGRVVPLPKPGSVERGYRYKGGDPGDEKNWVKLP